MVNFLRRNARAEFFSVISPGGLVEAAPVADEDQRHQADSQRERDDDPENHRERAGEADLRVADGIPEFGDHHDDGNYRDRGKRDSEPSKTRLWNAGRHLKAPYPRSLARGKVPAWCQSPMENEIADQEPASGNARAPRGVSERPDDKRRSGADLPDDELPI